MTCVKEISTSVHFVRYLLTQDTRRMHPVHRRRAAPRRDTSGRELRLYNGLITLPHFREALSRWGHFTFEPRAAPSSEALRSLGAIARPHDRTLGDHLAQRLPTCSFRFLRILFFLDLFFRLSADVAGRTRTLSFLFPCSIIKCFLPYFARR